ncbi:MAG: hypothetical protein Q9181_003050 [Wetmoreana brouardii]
MPAIYDTFLVQEPLRQDPFAVTQNPSDTVTLLEVYNKSSDYFSERSRRRAVERLQYEIGLLYMREGRWKKALDVLRPLWQSVSWRREGWWGLLGGLGEAVRECARECGDRETVVMAGWESMCTDFPRSQDDDYDFSRCLEGMEILGAKPRVVVRAEEVLSPLSLTFAFGATQGNVGEPLPAQIVIDSHAQRFSAPFTVSQIVVSFDGGQKYICVEHDPMLEPVSSWDNLKVYDIGLHKPTDNSELDSSVSSLGSNRLQGTCDLTFSPGKRKAISFRMIPRDSGIIRVASITSNIETNSFSMNHVVSQSGYMRQDDFWTAIAEGVSRRPPGNNGANELRIHPKPPKMQIKLPELKKEYLTDETINLYVEITNEEDDDAELTLEARFLGQADVAPTWTWITDGEPSLGSEDPLRDSKNRNVSRINLGQIHQSGKRRVEGIFTAKSLPTEAVLEVKALYHLLAEPDTPISKVLIQDVIFDRPFEANYDFQPCIDTEPWPSYFNATTDDEADSAATGLRQVWQATARLASFAPEPLVVEHVGLEAIDTQGRVLCEVSSASSGPVPEAIIPPNDFYEPQYDIIVQKIDLDDRRSAAIQFQLEVRWCRQQNSAPSATTIVPVPDLVIPFGEPRVLAAAGPAHGEAETVPLAYTIENPSTHVLNFELTMETNDEFAFSGPKSTSLNVVPVSRHTIRYILMPLVRGKWITPHFRVLDTHFNQVLRVHGTGGMRSDKKGASIWVDAEE